MSAQEVSAQEVSAQEVSQQKTVLGGYGVKGMRWRNKSVIAASRHARRYRRDERLLARNPYRAEMERQIEDERLFKANPFKREMEDERLFKANPFKHSKSRSRSHRSQSRSRVLESPGREFMGHTIRVLKKKSGHKPAGSLYYIHNGEKVFKKSWNKTLQRAWDKK